MSPEGQQLMAELQRLFKEQTQILDRRFADAEHSVEQRIIESETHLDSILIESERRQDGRLKIIEKVMGGLEEWRQDAEGVLDDMRLKVLKLNKAWDRSVVEQSSSALGLIAYPPGVEQTDKRPSAVEMAARPSGHGVDTPPRENEFGVVTTLTHSPANGTNSIPQLHGTAYDLYTARNKPLDPHSWPPGRLPKFPFPTFHGENIRLWISNAKDYFDMYQVESHLWLKIAKQQFKDTAARWIQSIEPLLKSLDWPTFCCMLHERFGCDQHQILIHRMFHIHQESTVTDYVERFSELIDQLTKPITQTLT